MRGLRGGMMGRVASQVATKAHTARTLVRAGVIRPQRPDRLLRIGVTLARWGATPAAGYTAANARHPDDLALIDELGALTFREVHERSNALAHALTADGLSAGDTVALMCRNHRGFIVALVACAKLGIHVVLLNTAFSAPQLADVCEREQPVALVYDEEFAGALQQAGEGRRRYRSWREASAADLEVPHIDELIAAGSTDAFQPPAKPGRTIILTSGTTGQPKGAARALPKSLDPAAALLSVMPLKARERTMIAAPMFHSWGFANFALGLSLGSTYVLNRRFDPEATLALLDQHACEALVVVPIMLQRILALDEAILRRHDLSALRVVAVSGSALPSAISERWMDLFGENLYNLYGSTEVAWATIATPQDLRAAPGTAGRPPHGTVVRIYDDAGQPLPAGQPGRIFVGNEVQMEGYTGGGSKEAIEALLSSGDVGHFDDAGRLFIDGRDDEMIVSGGENVFPAEVEELLAGHEAVAEVAVLGVDDKEWGQRLRAVIVIRPGAQLAADDVKRYVKENLAAYKVPRHVDFIDELPRTSTGKVLKRELRRM